MALVPRPPPFGIVCSRLLSFTLHTLCFTLLNFCVRVISCCSDCMLQWSPLCCVRPAAWDDLSGFRSLFVIPQMCALAANGLANSNATGDNRCGLPRMIQKTASICQRQSQLYPFLQCSVAQVLLHHTFSDHTDCFALHPWWAKILPPGPTGARLVWALPKPL